jgi:uncharacterized protein YjiS (DUF1127 family)
MLLFIVSIQLLNIKRYSLNNYNQLIQLEFKESIMRDFEINEAHSRQAYGRLTWIVRLLKNWQMRKSLKRLQGFSDYQLRDIGLTRGDLNHLICLPLDIDLAWQVERHELLQSKNLLENAAPLALSAQERAVHHWTRSHLTH